MSTPLFLDPTEKLDKSLFIVVDNILLRPCELLKKPVGVPLIKTDKCTIKIQ
jgi:hypothetical protein